MATPISRLVCVAGALDGAPKGWAAEMLRDGEVALLADDDGGLEAINALAHALDLLAVRVIRREETPARQEQTVIAHAASLPLVWVDDAFSDDARTWARERRPMTLLVEVQGTLPDADRRRVNPFDARVHYYDATKSVDKQNNYGFTLGGPVIIPKFQR